MFEISSSSNEDWDEPDNDFEEKELFLVGEIISEEMDPNMCIDFHVGITLNEKEIKTVFVVELIGWSNLYFFRDTHTIDGSEAEHIIKMKIQHIKDILNNKEKIINIFRGFHVVERDEDLNDVSELASFKLTKDTVSITRKSTRDHKTKASIFSKDKYTLNCFLGGEGKCEVILTKESGEIKMMNMTYEDIIDLGKFSEIMKKLNGH